ncbi:MAG: hypothetical protein A4S09_12515 [Proteobacteria bacterium SG_bin7]|nr:MAG: hypothetical protein A4S09_12515 [Proteobacteria bacterium SG_bin7]
MSGPLVSVIVPYYNNEKTLPLALASVKAQTYENWECLIIDDGSEQNPANIIDKFKERRFRLILCGENRGRGYARQKGLDSAIGKYIAMVDADDWIYPDKLAKQVDYLESNPEVALVSSGMAIIGETGELAGVRKFGEKIFEPLKAPMYLPIPHAPSMIRAEIAREAGYDAHLRIVEDYDFLLKISLKHSFATLSEPLYAYTEFATLDLKKMMASQMAMAEVVQKYRSQYPKEVQKLLSKMSLKAFGYTALFALGAYKHLIVWRTRRASNSELAKFLAARNTVYSI